MLKVSILIPIYGVEQYIEECVISLFEQTYLNIEYVFVNDSTKDKSIEILKNVLCKYPHREPQIKIINHEINKGLGAARKTALLYSTGDYIIHVDSDDYIANNAVEILINKATASHVDIVDCAFVEVGEGKQSPIKLPFHGKDEQYMNLILSRTGVTTNQIWGRLIKRSLYKENDIVNKEGVNLGEDYSVLPLLLYKGKRSFVDDGLYFYRVDNKNSYMNTCLSKKSIESCIMAHNIVYEYLIKKKLSASTKYSIEFGMLNLIMFCHKNKYDYQRSNLKINVTIDFCDLKIYNKILLYHKLYNLSLVFKAILTRKFLNMIEKR